MAVQVRTPEDRDFFDWLGLYADYGEVYHTPITDEKALLVWSWITDPNNEANALLAAKDDGTLVGLAHYREFIRPLSATRGLWVDDLFVTPDERGTGVGTALVNAVRETAAERKLSVVRLTAAESDETARKLYDDVATRTDWITYDITV